MIFRNHCSEVINSFRPTDDAFDPTAVPVFVALRIEQGELVEGILVHLEKG
jgi:hypothetical protein